MGGALELAEPPSADGLEDEHATISAIAMKASRKTAECRKRMKTAFGCVIAAILLVQRNAHKTPRCQ